MSDSIIQTTIICGSIILIALLISYLIYRHKSGLDNLAKGKRALEYEQEREKHKKIMLQLESKDQK